ncbi:MAG: ABC-three component system protein [Planctomycetota bacterium]
MTGNANNPFSATDPTLGYLYQIRSALLWSLQKLKSAADFLVSVETLDDVAFEAADGSSAELLQTKHHRSATASLTDYSPDLWKTLRVWFSLAADGKMPTSSALVLVTTGVADADSAASRLRASGRDVATAKRALDEVASSSSNQALATAFAMYLETTAATRLELLERIVVIDAAPLITDLDAEIRREVYWAAGKKDHDAFVERLEGWWYHRVLHQLTSDSDSRIGSVELDAQMSDLREQFKQDSLPIDDDLLGFSLDEATRTTHDASTFVRQVELVKAGKQRIASAIRDYYRAFEQRSRWLRQDLVVEMELHSYEKRLVEEWELFFAGICDDLGSDDSDQLKEQAGRQVLKWAEHKQIAIRPAVTEPFVCRGSFHMLADESRIGWHPDFRNRLAVLLGDSEVPD